MADIGPLQDCCEDEVWLPVVGFDGYEVSDHGHVRSVPRVITARYSGKEVLRKMPGVPLSPARHPFGHLLVGLSTPTGRKMCKVHHLVLTAFVGDRPEGQEGLHGDDDPSNNHRWNLRWGTRAENVRQMFERGRSWQQQRKVCPRDHRLVRPNLTADGIRKGIRACLACHRAAASVSTARRRHGVILDMRTESDRYYGEIMSAVGFPPDCCEEGQQPSDFVVTTSDQRVRCAMCLEDVCNLADVPEGVRSQIEEMQGGPA